MFIYSMAGIFGYKRKMARMEIRRSLSHIYFCSHQSNINNLACHSIQPKIEMIDCGTKSEDKRITDDSLNNNELYQDFTKVPWKSRW